MPELTMPPDIPAAVRRAIVFVHSPNFLLEAHLGVYGPERAYLSRSVSLTRRYFPAICWAIVEPLDARVQKAKTAQGSSHPQAVAGDLVRHTRVHYRDYSTAEPATEARKQGWDWPAIIERVRQEAGLDGAWRPEEGARR